MQFLFVDEQVSRIKLVRVCVTQRRKKNKEPIQKTVIAQRWLMYLF